MEGLIAPHGGRLINRVLEGKERQEAEARAKGTAKKLPLTDREVSDLEMIAIGAFSPLEGFMCKDDYHSVMDTMTLKNGLPWTIPVTLSTTEAEAKGLKQGMEVALTDSSGAVVALMTVNEIFQHDKEKEAMQVYGTREDAHPGVKKVYEMGEVLIGGPISLVKRSDGGEFKNERLDPKETRALFKEKGWKRVVGFQTRNPIHRAHEYIQKCALEVVDGLMIHPLVGETKGDDIPASVRMRCYKSLIDNYYP
ncbi:MAG: sulfate adenylyltransferase, partial [Deltaproteobacteria bacterium]